MSEYDETDATQCCASCGIVEIDDIKLVPCDDCDLVKYCTDECRKDHTSEHEIACKQRAAEMRDELLFKQPESTHLGDCPICCLPLPLDKEKSNIYECCSKVICNGCSHTNWLREIQQKLQQTCPFCREAVPENEEGDKKNMMRIEANDPVAMVQRGMLHFQKEENKIAFDYFTKATQFGDAEAHYRLAQMYHFGEDVEKDKEKKIHHLEEAALRGHPSARFLLGYEDWGNKVNAERAVKHWIIAATQGDDDSIKALMSAFRRGQVSKEALASALRAHQAALDAINSPQRNKAGEYGSWKAGASDCTIH